MKSLGHNQYRTTKKIKNTFVKQTKPCNVGLCKRHMPQKDKLENALNRAHWGLGGGCI